MGKCTVAIVGCGRISSVYREALKHLGELAQPVLAFDKVLERAEIFAAEFPGCRAIKDLGPEGTAREMKGAGVDLVHILLPHHLHCAYAVAAMEAGIHVLTEKPIATTREDADIMLRTRDKTGMELGVIFQNRFIPGVIRLRQGMVSGEFGKLRGVYSNLNWHRPPSYYSCEWKGKWVTEGGGVVIDQAIHSIDLVRYITGQDAVRIQGHVARRVLTSIEVEDEADAAICLKDGTVYSFFACNYFAENSPIRIGFSCEKASALLVGETVTINWKDGRQEQILPGSAGTAVLAYWGRFHQVQMEQCYRALLQGEHLSWSGEDAVKTLDIVLGIYESARTGKPVELA